MLKRATIPLTAALLCLLPACDQTEGEITVVTGSWECLYTLTVNVGFPSPYCAQECSLSTEDTVWLGEPIFCAFCSNDGEYSWDSRDTVYIPLIVEFERDGGLSAFRDGERLQTGEHSLVGDSLLTISGASGSSDWVLVPGTYGLTFRGDTLSLEHSRVYDGKEMLLEYLLVRSEL